MANIDDDYNKPRRLVFRGDGDSVKTFLMRLGMALHLRSEIDDDKKKIAYASSFLEGGALLWFEHMNNDTAPEDMETTFDMFKDDLKAAYLNPLDEVAARLELASLKFNPSAAMTVSKFEGTQFTPLTLRLSDESQKTLAFTFAMKLPPAMQAYVLQQTPDTVAEALSAARIFESSFGATVTTTTPIVPAQLQAAEAITRADVRAMFAEFAAVQTHGAYSSRGARGGYARGFPARGGSGPPYVPRQRQQLSDQDRERCMRERRCFSCKKVGHSARECKSAPADMFPPS